jgi:hypothetical protein
MAEMTDDEKQAEIATKAVRAKSLAEAEAAVKAAEAEAAASAAAAKKAAEAADRYQIEVRTTAIGAMPESGLVPVGKVMKVPYTSFSEAWMKPSTVAQKNKLAKLQGRTKKDA